MLVSAQFDLICCVTLFLLSLFFFFLFVYVFYIGLALFAVLILGDTTTCKELWLSDFLDLETICNVSLGRNLSRAEIDY